MVELDIIAPLLLVRVAPGQSQFHISNMGPPIGSVRDMTGMAQIALQPEHIEELPSPGALLPKNRPDLRSPPADVRQGPFVSVQVNVDEDGLNIIGDAANEPSIAINHGHRS